MPSVHRSKTLQTHVLDVVRCTARSTSLSLSLCFLFCSKLSEFFLRVHERMGTFQTRELLSRSIPSERDILYRGEGEREIHPRSRKKKTHTTCLERTHSSLHFAGRTIFIITSPTHLLISNFLPFVTKSVSEATESSPLLATGGQRQRGKEKKRQTRPMQLHQISPGGPLTEHKQNPHAAVCVPM